MKIDRRSFLKTSTAGAAGLVIGFYLPGRFEALAAAPADAAPASLNAWMLISPDDTVTIMIDKSEMGQGILTALCMIAAEELDCDWKKIRTEFAPAAKEYFNPAFGMQGTGGSSSVRSSWDPLRKAGAAAREMLLQAAAQKWGVDKSACRAENGVIFHDATKRKLTYGSVARSGFHAAGSAGCAAQRPEAIPHHRESHQAPGHAGQSEWPRGVRHDVRRPGMLYAVVAALPGVRRKSRQLRRHESQGRARRQARGRNFNGIAVVADNTWTAMQGRRALDVKWDEGPNATLSSDSISKLFAEHTMQPGAEARKEGDAAAALAGAAQKIEAVYEVPFLAHATMEPLNCTADVHADRWTSGRPRSCKPLRRAPRPRFAD